MSSAALWVFSFTEAQRVDVAHAVLNQIESLETGREAHCPDVLEAIFRLEQVQLILDQGRLA